MSNGIGRVWAVNAEGGDEGRPNGVGPVWIENADQLGSKLPEPEAGDAGKVLGVLNSSGDLGWVVDQSGTLTQVQADWDQTDSSQVSYIANKPNLATVATSGSYNDLSNKPTIPTVDQTYDASSTNAQSGVAVAGAIATKQDTISDLATIRSGAEAGATAVQPAALNDYATTSALTSGLAAKQDTISDLATIRSGASAGATAVQPAALNDYATTAALTSGLAAKQDIISDLATIRSGAAAGATAVQPSSLATVATTGSYDDLLDKPTIPPGVVVDQTYNAASSNAQSGVAVASAVSGKQDTINDLETIRSGAAAGATAVQPAALNDYATTSALTSGLSTKQDTISDLETIRSGAAAGATAVQPSSLATVATTGSYSDLSGKPTIPTATSDLQNDSGFITLSDVPAQAQANWSETNPSSPSYIQNKPTIPPGTVVDQTYDATSANAQSGVAVAGALATVKQVPSSTSSDEDKVLTVDSNGDPVWAAAQGGSSYTAGDGIAITNNEIKVRVKDDNPLKVSTQQQSGGYASIVTPEGTPSSEGWKALQPDPYYFTREYDDKHDVTHIGFRYLWNRNDPNPLGMISMSEDSTKQFDAKIHLLWFGKESYTAIVATSDTVSDAFTAGWDGSHSLYTYSLGSLVETTDDGDVFSVEFDVSGDHTGDWSALAFSSSGSDYSGILETVQSSFLSESHVLALQGDDVYIVGETIPGGDLYVDVATEWDPYSDKIPTCSLVDFVLNSRIPSAEGVDNGAVLTAGYDSAGWEIPTKVEYANQELNVQPPYGESLTIDASDATPTQGTESYEEGLRYFSPSTLVAEAGFQLGEKDLVSVTLHIASDIEATGITLNDLEFNYYQGDHGSYTEESVSPMVVTGAISASPSKILAGDYVVPIVPNPDPTYGALCIKFTYSGSPDPADLDAFASALLTSMDYNDWRVSGDMRVVTGYSIKPAVLPSLTGNQGKVLAVNSGATGLEWVTVGGGSDQPLPAVEANTMRFEFADAAFDPTTSAETSVTGATWSKVSQATTRNVWDCTASSFDSLFKNKITTVSCKVIDGNINRLWETFSGCTGLTSILVTEQIGKNVRGFYNCTNLEYAEIHAGGTYTFSISTASQDMFYNCANLRRVKFVKQPGNYRVYGLNDATACFYGCNSLEAIEGDVAFGISHMEQQPSINGESMFANCYKLKSVDNLYTGSWSGISISNANSMFSNCYLLKSIGFPMSIAGGSCESMFSGCINLEHVALIDLQHGNRSMASMFRDCYSLQGVNLLNTEAVTNMSSAFMMNDRAGNYGICNSLLKLPVFPTDSVTNVSSMFAYNIYADGALAMYQQMSQQANPPTTTTNCFTKCGSSTTSGAADLASIPSAWGGTGS